MFLQIQGFMRGIRARRCGGVWPGEGRVVRLRGEGEDTGLSSREFRHARH
jgi:hypothetical protein